MDILTYADGWTETPHRNPEALTKLAPRHLQEICLRYGGRHPLKNVPNFRLVLLSSRYQLAGGQKVTKLDSNGNLKAVVPKEVFLPRYHVPESHHGLYVLEMYQDCASLIAQGYGVNDIEYDDIGKGVRSLEPAWVDGCYEAVWNGPQNPFVFKRQIDFMTTFVRWAVFAVQMRLATRNEEIRAVKAQQHEKDKAATRNETLELLRSKRRAFMGEPMVSFAT